MEPYAMHSISLSLWTACRNSAFSPFLYYAVRIYYQHIITIGTKPCFSTFAAVYFLCHLKMPFVVHTVREMDNEQSYRYGPT